VARATSDFTVSSQPRSITALGPNYTAWWQRHECRLNDLPRVAARGLGCGESNLRLVDRKPSARPSRICSMHDEKKNEVKILISQFRFRPAGSGAALSRNSTRIWSSLFVSYSLSPANCSVCRQQPPSSDAVMALFLWLSVVSTLHSSYHNMQYTVMSKHLASTLCTFLITSLVSLAVVRNAVSQLHVLLRLDGRSTAVRLLIIKVIKVTAT